MRSALVRARPVPLRPVRLSTAHVNGRRQVTYLAERIYPSIDLQRDGGVVEMALHTEGRSLHWDHSVPRQLSDAFARIGADPANRVLIVTGTGDVFSGPPGSSTTAPALQSAAQWQPLQHAARLMHTTFLDIPFPVISCINGPAERHAELPLLADIVLASDNATIRDSAHFVNRTVPGDGINIVLSSLIGWNRARYHMLTGQAISAPEALRLGLVAELHPRSALLERARQLATDLVRQDPLVLRYTRQLFTHQIRGSLDALEGFGLALEGLALLNATDSVRQHAESP
jgi:enoyl-CoA hydratase/carnithine racemase